MSAACNLCINKNNEIIELKHLLKTKEDEITVLKSKLQKYEKDIDESDFDRHHEKPLNINLGNDEIMRYGRQLILPQIGIEGQKKLKACSVLIVGAGGLGCPVGLYLTAAGIGTIGIVDYDLVETNNLHRQVLHTERNVGISKCQSFVQSLKHLNSKTSFVPYKALLNSKNAMEIIKDYDVIVDASDNAPTRYLINDAACILNKPLVSGAALRFEGQLTTYNTKKSPCYRCLYPNPPTLTTNCSEGGVVGVITGVIGCLQALEVIKIAVGLPLSYENKLLLFDGESGQFRCFNLRGKNPNCATCGTSPTITQLVDYELFCNSFATDKIESISLLEESERISCKAYKNILDNNLPHLLLDVRPNIEIQICSLPNSFNVPYDKLINGFDLDIIHSKIKEFRNTTVHYVICRRGNDSQRAVQFLKSKIPDVTWFDICGGFEAWHSEADSSMPLY